MIAEELQVAGLVDRDQLLQEQRAEQAREHAHRQGSARHPALSVERDAAAWHDHVDVRVMGHGRAPAVQHGGDADAGAEMRRRQREHDVIVRHGQQIGLALGEPLLRRGALALRAMPIATRVVGDLGVGAILASLDMPAERRRAAALDG